MKDYEAVCVEQDDSKEYVLHKVYAQEDGVNYYLDVVARSPDLAIDVARWVNKDQWQLDGGN